MAPQFIKSAPQPASSMPLEILVLENDETFSFDPNLSINPNVFFGTDKNTNPVIIKRAIIESEKSNLLKNEQKYLGKAFKDRVVGSVTQGSYQYLVLQRVSGVSLLEIIENTEEHNLSVSQILNIINNLFLSTVKLHRANIFQHDIHPGNFIYDSKTSFLNPIDFELAREGDLVTENLGNGNDYYNIYTAKNLKKQPYLTRNNNFLYNANTDWFSVIKLAQALVVMHAKKYPQLEALRFILERELEIIVNLQLACLDAMEQRKKIEKELLYNPNEIRHALGLLHVINSEQLQPNFNSNLHLEAVKTLFSLNIDFMIDLTAQKNTAETSQSGNSMALKDTQQKFIQLKEKVCNLSTQKDFTRYKNELDLLTIQAQPILSKEKQELSSRISQAFEKFLAWLFPSYAARSSEDVIAGLCRSSQRPSAPPLRPVFVM